MPTSSFLLIVIHITTQMCDHIYKFPANRAKRTRVSSLTVRSELRKQNRTASPDPEAEFEMQTFGVSGQG